jgi:hypothetical protein
VLIGVLGAKRERWALVKSVHALGCPACGGSLSEDSVRVAEELWGRHVGTLMMQNPDVKFRLGRRMVDAVCSACATRLRLDQNTGKLEPVTITLSFESTEPENS